MLLHHAAAVALIALSYLSGFAVVGVGVLAVHEVSDILLHASKAAHYMGDAGTLAANVLFATTILSWAATRLGCFPRIVWGSATEAPAGLPQQIAVALLSVLVLLHVYWFRLMVNILLVALSGKRPKDPGRRSKDEKPTPIGRFRRAAMAVHAAVRLEHLASPRASPVTAAPPALVRRKSSTFYQASFGSRHSSTLHHSGTHLFPEPLPPSPAATKVE